jgi:signal transduction histidine kinase
VAELRPLTTSRAAVRPVRPRPSARIRAAWRDRAAVRRQAAKHERQRLARDLHDGAIQEILAAGLTIDLCLAELPAGSPARAQLEEARQLTGTAMRRLRSLLQGLREVPDTSREELPDMLRRLRAGHPGHQLDVAVEVTGAPVPVAPAVRHSLFRVASECVFNAAVHGRARRTVVRLSYGHGVVGLSVADDGQGKPKTLRKIIRGAVPGTGGGYHFGLADIAVRVDEMGGTVRVDRSGLGGIAVQVLVPVTVPAGGAEGEE